MGGWGSKGGVSIYHPVAFDTGSPASADGENGIVLPKMDNDKGIVRGGLSLIEQGAATVNLNLTVPVFLPPNRMTQAIIILTCCT